MTEREDVIRRRERKKINAKAARSEAFREVVEEKMYETKGVRLCRSESLILHSSVGKCQMV